MWPKRPPRAGSFAYLGLYRYLITAVTRNRSPSFSDDELLCRRRCADSAVLREPRVRGNGVLPDARPRAPAAGRNRRCCRSARSRARLEADGGIRVRSEEHTSELQSLAYLVCR